MRRLEEGKGMLYDMISMLYVLSWGSCCDGVYEATYSRVEKRKKGEVSLNASTEGDRAARA